MLAWLWRAILDFTHSQGTRGWTALWVEAILLLRGQQDWILPPSPYLSWSHPED